MKSFKQYITELYDDQSDLDKEVYDFHKDNTVKKNHPVADVNFEVKPGKDKSRKADQDSDTEYKKLNASKTMKSTDTYKFKKFAESEDLSEISKQRLHSYVMKASDDKGTNIRQGSEKDKSGKSKEADKHFEKVPKDGLG